MATLHTKVMNYHTLAKHIPAAVAVLCAAAALTACQDDKLGSLYPEGPDGHGQEITFASGSGFAPDIDSRGCGDNLYPFVEGADALTVNLAVTTPDGHDAPMNLRMEVYDQPRGFMSETARGGAAAAAASPADDCAPAAGGNASRGTSTVLANTESFGVSCLMTQANPPAGTNPDTLWLFQYEKTQAQGGVYDVSYNTDGTVNHPGKRKFKMANTYYWPGTTDYNLTFYGIHPLYWPATRNGQQGFNPAPQDYTCPNPANTRVMPLTGDSANVIHYTAPTYTPDQQDIVVAQSATMSGDSFTPVTLDFHHVTTRVGFYIGNAQEEGYLMRLQINGVHSSGTYTVPTDSTIDHGNWRVGTDDIKNYTIVGPGSFMYTKPVEVAGSSTSGQRITGTLKSGGEAGLADVSPKNFVETETHYNCLFMVPQELPDTANIVAAFIPKAQYDAYRAANPGKGLPEKPTYDAIYTTDATTGAVHYKDEAFRGFTEEMQAGIGTSQTGASWGKNKRVYYFLQLDNKMHFDGLANPIDAHFSRTEVNFWAPVNANGWTLTAEAGTPTFSQTDPDEVTAWTKDTSTDASKLLSFRDKLVGFEKPEKGNYWIYQDNTDDSGSYLRYSVLKGDQSGYRQKVYVFLRENADGATVTEGGMTCTKPRYFKITLASNNTHTDNKGNKIIEDDVVYLKQLGVCWQTDTVPTITETINGTKYTHGGYGYGCERLQEDESKGRYGFDKDAGVYYYSTDGGNSWGNWNDVRTSFLMTQPGLSFYGDGHQHGDVYVPATMGALPMSDYLPGRALVILGYKMPTIIPLTSSEADGRWNTWNLFNQSGGPFRGYIPTLMSIVKPNGQKVLDHYWASPTDYGLTTGNDFSGLSTLDGLRQGTVALEALKKNGFNITSQTITGVGTVYLPDIAEIDVKWFLPAINQYSNNGGSTLLTDAVYPLTGQDWSSTAILNTDADAAASSRMAWSCTFPGGTRHNNTVRSTSLPFRACRVRGNAGDPATGTGEITAGEQDWGNGGGGTSFD